MSKYNLLYKLQFGFRKEQSTQHALITLVDNITKALDEGIMLIGVFLDLSWFDCVDQNMLLRKLYAYGIRGSMHTWFASYLHNRQQFVKINDSKSGIKTINRGVP